MSSESELLAEMATERLDELYALLEEAGVAPEGAHITTATKHLIWERDRLAQMMEYIENHAPLEGWIHESAYSVLAEIRKGRAALEERHD